MKNKEKAFVRKSNGIAYLFLRAITYRTPRLVRRIIVYSDDAAYLICPMCKMSLDREYIAFCDRYGQKLNWKFFDHAKVVRSGFHRK